MAYISKRNRRREREIRNAAKNRREIIAARLSRRDMIKAGLLTSAGYLIQKNGLSARAQFGGGGGFGQQQPERQERMKTLEGKDGILSISIVHCFPYADVPENRTHAGNARGSARNPCRSRSGRPGRSP